MEKIKRIFSLILVLALMVSMFPAVYAAEITEGDTSMALAAL